MRLVWFRLASELGWPVGLLQQVMTSREFSEWLLVFGMRDEQDAGDAMAEDVSGELERKMAGAST